MSLQKASFSSASDVFLGSSEESKLLLSVSFGVIEMVSFFTVTVPFVASVSFSIDSPIGAAEAVSV